MDARNKEIIENWGGDVGKEWVRHAPALDRMMEPLAEAIIERAALKTGEQALDIGCGAGALSLMAYERTQTPVMAVDVSRDLLALANSRAKKAEAHIETLHADATDMTLPHPANITLSRFGVMFFSDPVMAFSNIRKNCTENGRLVFACWQSMEKSGWAALPLRAARPFLKQKPEPQPPGTPGPFAFDNPDYVRDLLQKAGWSDINIEPWEGLLSMPGRGATEVANFMLEMGPASRLVREQEIDLAPVHASLVEALRAYEHDGETYRLPARVWMVRANV